MKLALAALALAVLASAPARAEAPHVQPGFDRLELPLPETRLDVFPEQLGLPRTEAMMSCNNDNLVTTAKPTVSFVVDAPTTALLTIQGAPAGLDLTGVVLMLPGDRVMCVRGRTRHQSQVWAPGTYGVHVVANGHGDPTRRPVIPAGALRVVLDDLTPRREALDLSSGPNPRLIDGLRHDQRVEPLATFGATCPEASHATVAPALELTLAAPVARLRVAVARDTEALLVTDPSGRTTCTRRIWLARDHRYVDLADVPAGRLEIRTAGPLRPGYDAEASRRHVWFSEPFERPTFAVTVEDLGRPRDLPWAPADAPPVLPLTGPFKSLWTRLVPRPAARPLALGDTPSARLAYGDRGHARSDLETCAGFTRSDTPAVILDARRPMADVWYRATSHRPLRLVLAGPFDDAGRPADGYEERCLTAGAEPRAGFGDLDLGTWRAYLAQPAKAPADDAVLLIGTTDVPLDPLALYREPAGALDVAAMAVLPYFAGLPVDTNGYLAWSELTPFERQDLAARAPLVLFAYPKFDLDAAAASYWGVDPKALEAAGVPVTYPTADEPLLVLEVADGGQATVMTTDANLLSIPVKYLVAKPAGPARVPAAVRNLIIGWDDAVRWAAPEDAAEIARVEKAREKADACYQDYWSQHHGGVSGRLSLVTYVNGRVSSVRDYTQMVDDRATAKCGLKNVDKLQGAVLAKLDKRLRQRGAERLVEIAKRFGP